MVVGSETELPIGRTRLGAVRALARHLVREAGAAIRERGRYVLAIPGGNTPAPLFRVLESQYSHRIDWLHVHLLWTDERAVPPRDPRSNFGTGWKDGIGRLPLPPGQIYRIPCGDRTPEEARDTYESELAELIRPRPGAVGTGPDAVVLGVGTDGHTASLFPGSTSLEAEGRWVVTEPSPPMDPRVPRVSLSLPALRSARERLFLVTGREKRGVLGRLLGGPAGSEGLPAALVARTAPSSWFVDREALGPRPRRAPRPPDENR